MIISSSREEKRDSPALTVALPNKGRWSDGNRDSSGAPSLIARLLRHGDSSWRFLYHAISAATHLHQAYTEAEARGDVGGLVALRRDHVQAMTQGDGEVQQMKLCEP